VLASMECVNWANDVRHPATQRRQIGKQLAICFLFTQAMMSGFWLGQVRSRAVSMLWRCRGRGIVQADDDRIYWQRMEVEGSTQL